MGVISIQVTVNVDKMSIAHFLILAQGLLSFIPGLIHSYHPDGGAQSIAGFTNYQDYEQEVLFFFRNIGASQTVHGVFILGVLYLTVTDPNNKSYQSLTRFLLAYTLIAQLYSLFVATVTGNTLSSVAPNAPGRYSYLMKIVLSILSLLLF